MLFRAKTQIRIPLGAKSDQDRTERPPLEVQAGELVDLPLSTAQPFLAAGELELGQLTDAEKAGAAPPARRGRKGE